MEDMGIDAKFWKDREVLITGHTGFKGGWLALILHKLGAKVHGFALAPISEKALFVGANLSQIFTTSHIGNIADYKVLENALSATNPKTVFHLAAQPLVIESYLDPLQTFETNIMGTANLLSVLSANQYVSEIVNVTSDKCYENKNGTVPMTETDKLGGKDPYSSSKACSEIISNAYYESYFKKKNVGLATARAGNVIGGGDVSANRLMPDIIRSLEKNETLEVRNATSVRPWQHVLDPLFGYILLVQFLNSDKDKYSTAWNFGPEPKALASVETLVDTAKKLYPNLKVKYSSSEVVAEAQSLLIDSSKARNLLGWHPKWNLNQSVSRSLQWYEAHKSGADMLDFSLTQISNYSSG